MAADTAVEKRANLLASRSRWGTIDRHADEPPNTGRTGDYKQDSIQQWLISINRVDEKTEPVQKSAAESLQRNASAEDDLVLGVEASIYGNPGARTVKEFLRRSSLANSALPRWNSLTSAFSTQSSILSVMDVLNLWSDDPEEVLLDLGFGVEEPDITGRIPARFINNQSQARGINLQVFLEAQKNRMDIENPDVRSRFRQLEVLHQVTTAFNSLVGGGSSGTPLSSRGPLANMSPEAREKRKRMGMLLRRASKKTLSMARSSQEQPPSSPTPDSAADSKHPIPESSTPVHTHLSEKRSVLKRSRLSLVENGCLTPLVEEQGPLPEPSEAQAQAVVLPVGVQESTVRLKSTREARPPAPTPPLRKRSPGEHMESFELEEVQSFDEGSVAGSVSGMADCIGESERGFLSRAESSVIRTNSCQSDSSGFLEEPFIPVASQSPSPGPELMKALNAMSSSTDSQGTVRGSQEPSPTTPSFPTPIFNSVPPACDPEGPASDPAEPTAPPPGKWSPVDAPTTEEAVAAVVREDSSTMGSSQCCQSPEGIMCVDIHDMSAKQDLASDGPTESSVVQEGGEQPSSESNNEQEQRVRERAIIAVLEPTVSEEGVNACDECLTGEVSTSDGVVSLMVSVSAMTGGASCACRKTEDQNGANCVVSEQAASGEPVPCELVVDERVGSESTMCDCTCDMSGSASKTVVRKCDNVSDLADRTVASVGCSTSNNALKDCLSTELDAKDQVSTDDCARQTEKTEHKMKDCDTVISLLSTVTEENLTVPCDNQDSGDKGLSSKHAFFQQETKSHTSSQLTQMPLTETSQPVVSHELDGTSVDRDLAPMEPSGRDGRPCPPGRSVSVQMRSSLAPISQTALWKGVAPDAALQLSDVTQRRESFSRRARSEAEAYPTPQSLAVEIPELASAAPFWQSQDSSQGFGKFQTRSFSLDTGLSWEDGDGRLDGVMMEGRGTRWCKCQCLCCVQHGAHTLLSEPASSFPYSLDELEEMMRGVKRFRAVLTEVEERLGHEQASVYEDLSVSDREEVRDVLELRAAVKQEARELELQLTELVHHYDDSFKMKINRLLDEQSHLCSQLRIHPSDRPHPETASSRGVATQCSLLPETDTIDTCPPPPSSSCTTKKGKLDFVGFIQNLKNSLHRSISSDSLD